MGHRLRPCFKAVAVFRIDANARIQQVEPFVLAAVERPDQPIAEPPHGRVLVRREITDGIVNWKQ